MRLSALLFTLLLTLTGCGQKGPLVLPPDEPAGGAATEEPAAEPASQEPNS